jgi:transposase
MAPSSQRLTPPANPARFRLAARVQIVLAQDPYCGAMFSFRGRRGYLLNILVWDGQG